MQDDGFASSEKRIYPVCLIGSKEVNFYMILECLPPIGSHLRSLAGDVYKVVQYTFVGNMYASLDDLAREKGGAVTFLLVEPLGNIEERPGPD